MFASREFSLKSFSFSRSFSFQSFMATLSLKVRVNSWMRKGFALGSVKYVHKHRTKPVACWTIKSLNMTMAKNDEAKNARTINEKFIFRFNFLGEFWIQFGGSMMEAEAMRVLIKLRGREYYFEFKWQLLNFSRVSTAQQFLNFKTDFYCQTTEQQITIKKNIFA